MFHSLWVEQQLRLVKCNGLYLCKGSMVSPDFVLTAAHCLYDDSHGWDLKVHNANDVTNYIKPIFRQPSLEKNLRSYSQKSNRIDFVTSCIEPSDNPNRLN
ncbi:CLUMA_CG000347, isoform A [Clunio marinus]|uniref:CLUMA_CG000347, isoform A n=1 Tax=Clunio marinus TaxID=568069 RepID=A0A1J1HEV0_9DIPT|nr:CLUMA_CG000347, isoform A [Clunio marinus]